MDQLLALRVFIRFADARSFAKAADTLNLPRSSVSKLLQDLEQHIGTKPVERSTRALTITPQGEAYRDHALSLLSDLDLMDAAAVDARTSPRGRLRVDDRPVDLISEGVDCVIRGGALSDTSLIARKLCHLDSVMCATPAYRSFERR